MVPSGNLYSFNGHTPQVGAGAYVAPGSQVIGQVTLGEAVHILFNCVLRGDNAPITIGAGSNIQDNSTIHADPALPEQDRPEAPATLGRNVSVGHNCLLHGCTVEDEVLIGMGSVVMNFAHIGTGSIVGAGSVVLEGMQVPPYSLVVGSPARIKKTYGPDEVAGMLRHIAEGYQQRISDYKQGLRAVEPE